ncbi:MAG: type I phosphomannose isomerase catalytic subunit [Gemmatimonadota bacterium]|nr:type I phosphomannose isomerase catalytic subunit [Gemmatimonadota bacterium]
MMPEHTLYPMLLAPIFKDKIWGGRMMEKLLNKPLPSGLMIGESWELSAYREDITHVVNGPLAGTLLTDLFRERPRELTGRVPTADEEFPLLTKFIDSNQLLSLQVHPPDSYALEHDGEYGKTECWYIVYARPGASIIRGLVPGTSPEELRQGLETGRDLEKILRSFEVAAGDFIFMPTGVVHAIGEGTIVLEIEQNSDMTYRLHDWGRLGDDGKPRPTHIDKGMDVIDFNDRAPVKTEGMSYFEGGNRITHLASCKYFSAELLELESTYRLDTRGKTFVVLTVVGGAAVIAGEEGEQVRARKGDTVLLPAEPGLSTVVPEAGKGGRGVRIVKASIDPAHESFVEPLIQRGVAMEKIEEHIFR